MAESGRVPNPEEMPTNIPYILATGGAYIGSTWLYYKYSFPRDRSLMRFFAFAVINLVAAPLYGTFLSRTPFTQA